MTIFKLKANTFMLKGLRVKVIQDSLMILCVYFRLITSKESISQSIFSYYSCITLHGVAFITQFGTNVDAK